MKRILLIGAAFCAFTGSALAADCPPVTVANDQGIKGEFPQQFELAEFQSLASCTLSFKGNPEAAALNAKIVGNPQDLPAVEDRLPKEPLVVAPYEEIGVHGGILNGISKATESGTSDLLSVRHVNLVRYSDNLQDIVPNVAKSWEWNADFTQLTFKLRDGHKWSDGKPFTADDVAFWYNNMLMDKNVIEKPKDRFLIDGKPWTVEALDATTVRFTLAAPKPGLLAQFATDFAQPFQPKHFLGQFHPGINADADKLAKEAGFENGYEVIKFYYGGSDWKDVPSPYLKDASKTTVLPAAVVPTLESHIVYVDTDENRKVVANPYFHMVDTQGNQLPYINEIDEVFIADEQVQTLKMVNGEVGYKQQAVNLAQAPVLLENAEKGGYKVAIVPTVGENVIVSFNMTSANEAKRAVFNDFNFRKAMSIAIDRAEIIDSVYLGEGRPEQYTAWDANTVDFVTEAHLKVATEYNVDEANKLLDAAGLKDADGDGFRDLPNGERLVLNIQFSTQGTPAGIPEILATNWSSVGIQATAKEVTSDEYRAAQSANELDVHIWTRVRPGAVLAYNPGLLIPPFDNYFTHRNGMLWAQWIDTKGAEGIEPPADVKAGMANIAKFQSAAAGSAEQAKIGGEIVQTLVDNLRFIGLVGSIPAPVYHNDEIGNFKPMTAKTYDYYQMYPYRPNQYFIKK
ncbi:ABC transporter substrate-binding protein [Coralliovum pocilloporae]|uniref:ABC transporter substrate-binding protein n=1 Tax=Coralliovum pocilloporae TaxID=3066369 RepID=UPI00330750E8